ncbi:MAG: hypothetical protein E6G58_00910 [Actinobacteria bacterium]|nr:MAG: hypothetical protein E6G58_00910 [Actinomycetota bacterium]
MRRIMMLAVATLMGGALLAACSSGSSIGTAATSGPAPSGSGSAATPTEAPVSSESPVPVESNPPGDIPDNTVFVPYHSAKGGWTVTVPEGWSRTTTGTTVTFTDKLNTVQVDARPGTSVTLASAKKTDVPALARNSRAFKLTSVTEVTLPAGPAVLITYQANSDPNAVTGKQYRLDVLRYELFHAGTRTTLTLLSPVGADNVDPWRIVTQSLKTA